MFHRVALSIPLILALLSGPIFAVKKKKPGPGATTQKVITKEEAEEKKKAEAARTPEPVIGPENNTAGAQTEMDLYRQIQERPIAKVQDLADALLMFRGEFAKYETPEKRIARLKELGALKSYDAGEELRRGALAYAIMRTYPAEKGWIFWLTGFERYAIRDVQEADIMPQGSTPEQNLSGEQLIGTITAAEDFAGGKKMHPEKK